jgi:ribosomal protein S18 acetylase RimI-like enzyme
MKIDVNELVFRPVTQTDVADIVRIDTNVLKEERENYIKSKVDTALNTDHQVVASLVAEYRGKVVGFVMGNVYMGEFGIPEKTATIDTIGVDPDFQGSGVGSALLQRIFLNLSALGIEKVQTRVAWNDLNLIRFFASKEFTPAAVLTLERKI